MIILSLEDVNLTTVQLISPVKNHKYVFIFFGRSCLMRALGIKFSLGVVHNAYLFGSVMRSCYVYRKNMPVDKGVAAMAAPLFPK